MKTKLSPYCHELNSHGTDCSECCPACRWAMEQRKIISVVVIFGPVVCELCDRYSIVEDTVREYTFTNGRKVRSHSLCLETSKSAPTRNPYAHECVDRPHLPCPACEWV